MAVDYEGRLPGTISTMRKTRREPGSADALKGLMGAAALGPLSGPIGALANPVVGTGLGGALATLAMNPSDAEASLLLDLGKSAAKDIAKLRSGKKAWNLGGRKVAELSTRTPSMRAANIAPEFMNEARVFTGFDDIKNMTLKNFLDKGYTPQEAQKIMNGLRKTQKSTNIIPNETASKYLIENPDVRGYATAGINQTVGRGARSNFRADKNAFYNTMDHELQHLIQANNKMNPMNKSMLSSKSGTELPGNEYLNLGHEIESRIAGGRATYGPLLTSPESKYGVHPLLAYDKDSGKFSLHQGVNYVGRMVKDGKLAPEQGTDVLRNLSDEGRRLGTLMNQNPRYKKLLDGRYANDSYATGLGMDLFKAIK